MQGCGEGAKASTDLTHWPQAIARGARLVTGARVRRLVTDGRGLRLGRGVDRPRRPRAPADGRPRAVRGERHRHGEVAARVGVGRAARRPRQLVRARRSPADDAPAHDRARRLRRGARELAGPEGLVDPVARVLPDRRVTRLRPRCPVGARRRGRSARGRARRTVARGVPATIARSANGSGTPPRGSSSPRTCPTKPTASSCRRRWPTRRASSRPKVVYRLADNTHAHDRLERRTRARVARRSRRAPDEVDAVPARTATSWGPRAWAPIRRTSVVDPWGMAHDVANLGIVDGSVFVTAGAANPTSTICRARAARRRPPASSTGRAPDPRAAAPVLRRSAPRAAPSHPRRRRLR